MKVLQNLSGHRAEIKGERVNLRVLVPADASAEYAAWLNDEETNKYLETRSVTIGELKKYISKRDESDEALFFGVFWKENGKHMGNVKLEPIDQKKSTAVMGILIGDKDYWGMGVGTEVTSLITDYAFSDLGIEEVSLGVMADNKAAIRVYEKCGYKIDKVIKDGINHDGVLYDKICMKKKSSLKTAPVSV